MIEERLEGEELTPEPEGRGEPRADDDSGGGGLLQMSAAELKSALEAVLFSVSEPMPLRSMVDLFGVPGEDVRQAIEELRDDYERSTRSFRLENVAGGWQFMTLPAYAPWIKRLRQKQRESRLSAAAFETLAVIAYKQPITKADLEAIRGVQCAPILKTLMDRGLVKVVGRDESLGKPLLYGTTRRFLESFGLPSLRDLPQPEALPVQGLKSLETAAAASEAPVTAEEEPAAADEAPAASGSD